MIQGLAWTPDNQLAVLPTLADMPELLGTPIEERLHPRGDDIWHGQQGDTPHCSAYSWLHWYSIHHKTDEPLMRPRRFYRDAQDIGKRRGEGATLLDGRYVMGAYVGPFARITETHEVCSALLASGPVLLASTWTSGMEREEMKPTGRDLGAHGYLLDGYSQGMARVKNSLTRRTQWLDLTHLDRLRWEAYLALPNNGM